MCAGRVVLCKTWILKRVLLDVGVGSGVAALGY